MTKILKIFIDESGEFGFEQGSSELYVVSMVFYDTTINIDNFLHDFEDRLKRLGYSGMIHMADLVMNRGEYRNQHINDRRKLFNAIYQFTRKSPIKIANIIIDKKYTNHSQTLKQKIIQEFDKIITNNKKVFDGFNKILIYYDNGQRTLGAAIKEAFSILGNYEQVDKFNHLQERPFQSADMLTFIYKYYYNFKNKQCLSKGESYFFQSIEMLIIIKELEKKKLQHSKSNQTVAF